MDPLRWIREKLSASLATLDPYPECDGICLSCRRIGRAGSKQEHDGLPTGEEVSSAPRTIHDARPVKELKLSSGLVCLICYVESGAPVTEDADWI